MSYVLASLFLLVVGAFAYEVEVPEWRLEKEKISSGFAGKLRKALDENYKQCCLDFGVPEKLATIACKYRDFDNLEKQSEDEKGNEKRTAAGIELQLSKCNLVQHWPYVPQIAYCSLDKESITTCIEENLKDDETEYPANCNDNFASGNAPSAEYLKENAKELMGCFDFTDRQVLCARDALLERAIKAGREDTHWRYKEDIGTDAAPKVITPDNDFERSSVCELKSAGGTKDMVAERKLFLRICVPAEKISQLRYNRQKNFGKENNNAGGVSGSAYDFNDCE